MAPNMAVGLEPTAGIKQFAQGMQYPQGLSLQEYILHEV